MDAAPAGLAGRLRSHIPRACSRRSVPMRPWSPSSTPIRRPCRGSARCPASASIPLAWKASGNAATFPISTAPMGWMRTPSSKRRRVPACGDWPDPGVVAFGGTPDVPGACLRHDYGVRHRRLTAWRTPRTCEAPRGRGGTGRHAGFRIRWRKPWGFESLRPHQKLRGTGTGSHTPPANMRNDRIDADHRNQHRRA